MWASAAPLLALAAALASAAAAAAASATAAGPTPDRPQYICLNNNQQWHPNDPSTFSQATVDVPIGDPRAQLGQAPDPDGVAEQALRRALPARATKGFAKDSDGLGPGRCMGGSGREMLPDNTSTSGGSAVLVHPPQGTGRKTNVHYINSMIFGGVQCPP